MCLVGAIYAAAYVDESQRLALALVVSVAAIGGAVILWFIPWGRVITSPWRQWAFFSWTVCTVAIIAATAAVDGGAESPLALMLFLPVVFASLAYPLRLVIASAITAEAAFLLLILLDTGESPGAGFILAFCGALLGVAVMAVWQAGNHDVWRRELSRSSRTDPLTSLLNRRGFATASDAAFSALDRRDSPVTLLLIDLDLFKAYNDSHGHHAGDALLRWVAEQLSSSTRPTDSVARLGGDEFAVLLPDTDRRAADAVIARISKSLRPRVDHCLGRASAPEQGTTFDALYRVADTNLYQRKILSAPSLPDGTSPRPMLQQGVGRRTVSADAILAGITEAFYVVDEEWRFIYVNEEAERLLGKRADELLGRSVWLEFPAAVGSGFEEAFQRVAASGVSETFTEVYEPLGTTFSVKASSVPDGISVYFHDVSDWHAEPKAPNAQ
jgi:diguanylate cyclase (GGDEF)-like protein/PAS domain S-box-containing protein